MEEAVAEPERPITSGGSDGSVRSKTAIESGRSSQSPEERPVTEESSKESTSDPSKPHRTTITLTLAIAYPKRKSAFLLYRACFATLIGWLRQ